MALTGGRGSATNRELMRVLPWTSAVIVLALTSGCGSSRKLGDPQTGGAAGEGGESSGGTGGSSGSGVGGSDGGTGGSDGGTGGGAGDCEEDETRCADEVTPEVCEGGEWVAADECSGSAPLCSRGECSAIVLDGGLVSQRANTETGSIRLVDHGFETTATVCGDIGNQTVCVTGGLRP